MTDIVVVLLVALGLIELIGRPPSWSPAARPLLRRRPLRARRPGHPERD